MKNNIDKTIEVLQKEKLELNFENFIIKETIV